MGSTSFPIHRLLQCFGRSRAAIAALFCYQHSIFCVNLQGKPWFCTNILRFQQKISSIFIQHDRASAPVRSSVFLSLFVPLSGKSPCPAGPAAHRSLHRPDRRLRGRHNPPSPAAAPETGRRRGPPSAPGKGPPPDAAPDCLGFLRPIRRQRRRSPDHRLCQRMCRSPLRARRQRQRFLRPVCIGSLRRHRGDAGRQRACLIKNDGVCFGKGMDAVTALEQDALPGAPPDARHIGDGRADHQRPGAEVRR